MIGNKPNNNSGGNSSGGSFSFELPFFNWTKFAFSYSGLDDKVGYPAFSRNTFTELKENLITDERSLIFRIPHDCKLNDVVLICNGSSSYEFSILKTSNISGVGKAIVFSQITANSSINTSNINADCEKDSYLHIFFKDFTGVAGPVKARLFLKFD